MTNGQKTRAFFAAITAEVRIKIIANIAAHYAITHDAVIAEVTHDDAEHLLDYVTGSARAATAVFMQEHGLR